MIGFYVRGFATLGAILRPLRAWRRRHPIWSLLVGIILMAAAFVVFSTSYAWAAEGGGGPLAPFLPGGTLHDSAGHAVAYYTILPLDRGDAFTPLKGIPTTLMDMIWTYHLAFVAWTLWLLEWLLNFEWISWISEPFQVLATSIEGMLGDLAWIPLALSITGAVAGIALLTGRLASGFVELLISAVCVVLATGVLANPVVTLTTAGGALDKAQEYSAEVAAIVVSDNRDPDVVAGDVLSEAVTTQLVDIFIRTPAMGISFGRTLSGECAAVFDEAMQRAAPVMGGQNEVRDRVSECDPLAKFFVQNPNFGGTSAALSVAVGGTFLYGFALLVGLLLMVTVVFLLIAAIKAMFHVYLGMLPINRYPLWRALGDVFMGVVSIFVIVVAIAAYLKILVDVLVASSALGIVAQMNFVSIFMLVLIVVLWRIRRAAKKAGRSMAEQMAKLGLRSGGPRKRDAALAAATMSTVANAGINMLGRGKPTATKGLTKTAATTAAAAPLEDLGEMSVVRPPAGPHTGGPGSHGRQALAAPQKSLSGPAAAGKTADLVFKAVNIAKAAPGGPAALAGAAALEVGKDVASRVATKAINSGHDIPATPPVKHADSRRIVVGADGIGRIERPKVEQIYNVTTMPPTPPAPARSTRNEQLRELIASRKSITA